MTHPTLINLHARIQGLHYYPFAVNLDRRTGTGNTLNDLYIRICVPNKTEDINLSACDMITGINESKILTKHISWEWKCKFDGEKCNSNQKWNNNKYRCECKNLKEHHVCEKNYIWNPATCTYEIGEYLGSIMDEIIEATKTVPTKTFPTKSTSTNLYIYY